MLPERRRRKKRRRGRRRRVIPRGVRGEKIGRVLGSE